MESPLQTILSTGAALLLPLVLTYYTGIFKWLDFVVRVTLAEINRANNKGRLECRNATAEGSNDIKDTVISIVGYREEAENYERALETLKKSGAPFLIAGIDGDSDEDMKMVDTFNTVYDATEAKVLHLPLSIGKQFYREIRPADDNNPKRTKALDETDAFEQACDFLEAHLEEAGVFDSSDVSDLPQAICYTQPHGDLKEIRLTSWTMAVVLGKRYGFKYVWSTDSDTRVLPDTISTMAHTLAAEPNAGGASVHVRLHNEKETNIAQMTGLTFALDTYLNRAAAGALNKSEYLHGPATILRLSALEEVIVPWCRFHYFFSDRSQNTTINEDIQYSMLLAKKGWQRLYVETTSILTEGPNSLRTFLGQRLRWSRGIMAHRVLDASYIAEQGPITTLYMIRSAFYDALVFIWVSYYALYGTMLFTVTKWDILVFEILPPLYNAFRHPAPLPNIPTTMGLYALYRFCCPSFRFYTFLTPFNTAWALPENDKSKEFKLWHFVRHEHAPLFFTVWSGIATGAMARAISSMMLLDHITMLAVMNSAMIVGWSAAMYVMFAKEPLSKQFDVGYAYRWLKKMLM